MDTYAEDLAELVETLDLTDAIHVGHSTGGGEVGSLHRPPWNKASRQSCTDSPQKHRGRSFRGICAPLITHKEI